MNRESIYSALFALVSSVPGVVTASRRLRAFADIGPAETPALFMSQAGESVSTQTRMPSRWSLSVDIVVFINTGGHDSTIIPASKLNPIVDAIIAKLIPPVAIGEQTLGGLVERCRVDGHVDMVEGVQGDTAMAVIPVVIFLPD